MGNIGSDRSQYDKGNPNHILLFGTDIFIEDRLHPIRKIRH